METTNTKIELETKVPTLILTTLDILIRRHSSAQYSDQDLHRYQYLLEERSDDICNWYENDNEALFYDGFIHEGCFLLACNNCLQKNILITTSNAQEDLDGRDFILKEGKSEKFFDVTIRAHEYARKLSYENKMPILLPIHNAEIGKTYAENFLGNPTKKDYQNYLKHVVRHNKRILDNKFLEKFELSILKKKNEKPETLFCKNNGSVSYFIRIHKTKYNKIMRILNTFESLTL